MPLDVKANKEKFIQIFRGEIHREGADALLQWLEDSDFFTAPATGQYVLSCEGGLCQHSLNAFRCLTEMVEKYRQYDPNFLLDPDLIATGKQEDYEKAVAEVDQSIAIVGLLHKIAHVNCWVFGTRNVKTPEGKWVAEPCYKWDEEFIYGNGSKSVFIIQQFMRLYMEEAQAIRFYAQGKEIPYSDAFESTFYAVYETNSFAAVAGAAINEATNVLDQLIWQQVKPQEAK